MPSNSCDIVNNNISSQESYKVSSNESHITSSMSNFVYEVCDKDINHNDILLSSTIISKPTTTASSSCTWWMLFLVNPRKQPQTDSDILKKDEVSSLPFQCNHTNVNSKIKNTSILKARQTQEKSVSNCQFSLTPTVLKRSLNSAANQVVRQERNNATNIDYDNNRIYNDENYQISNSDDCRPIHSSYFGIPRKARLVGMKKKTIVKFLVNFHVLLICLVLFCFSIKTWTRNQDWNSRKTLFK